MPEAAVDGELKVGDTAHDLVKRGKVQIVGVAAESVAAHQDQEDYDIASYKAHPLLDVQSDDTVWTCVYLPDEPQVSFSGTYDFPESRLARIPIEAADSDLRRHQQELVVGVLEQAFASMRIEDVDEETIGEVADNLGAPFGLEPVDEAMELAEVDDVIGGDDDAE